jgi:phage tail-like protein
MPRDIPYGNFNFLVRFSDGDIGGGFSDVTGIASEITVAEYREGTDKLNHVRKVPGLHKNADITLKRGIVNSGAFWGWLDQVHRTGQAARRDVVIVLQDETHTRDVQQWKLGNAFPMKYTGPTLAAKGGTDVAMEEWVLAYETLIFEQLEA